MNGPGFVDDRRGVSEVVGYVLLVGMTAVGVSLIVLAGSAMLADVQGQTTDEATELAVHELEGRFQALTKPGVDSTEVTFGDRGPREVTVVDNRTGGHIRVTVEDDGTYCRATVPLSSVRYEDSKGQLVGYEAGGIFIKSSESSSSTVRSPPSLVTDNGTVDVTVINVSGRYRGGTAVVRKDAALSRNQSAEIEADLFNSSTSRNCRRPDNVTIEVKSDFYDAWAEYLESETGTSAATTDSNSTARVRLGSTWLPAAANDSENQVVNLTRATGSCSAAQLRRGCVVSDGSRDQIKVDKSVGNRYTALAEPLGSGAEVTSVRTVKGKVAYRPALDVVFVIDESGSMAYNANTEVAGCEAGGSDPGCQSKREAAQVASKGFVEQLNESKDRVGFVGYDTQARYIRVDGEYYFTDDFSDSGAKATIDQFDQGGGTASNTGVQKANALFSLKGNASKKRVMILLSDGQNSDAADDERLYDAAREARDDGVVVYTVGFGSEDSIDSDVLRKTATITGGKYYYADDAGRLDAVFDEIFAKISDSKVVVHHPVTMQTTVGGTTYQPTYADSNTSYIANVTEDGNTALNINDPAAPSPYSFSTSAEDGSLVSMTTTEYQCEEYRLTGQTVVNTSATPNQTYQRVSCAPGGIDASSGRTVEPSAVSIYLDGEDASGLLSKSSGWWQEEMAETLEGHLTDPAEGDTVRFDLQSNQAVVVFQFPSGEDSYNRIVVLYEIGADADSSVTSVVDVRVVSAHVGDE
ncbi:VWA domain-containing protein [Halobium palmae]|uniref:VWA domain-containing protein n=1 Tax=Halobium palmae TaxID=1776492 RepID=A0ABD5RV96_9EURY